MDPAADKPIPNGSDGLFLLMKWGSGGLDDYGTMATLLDREILGTACETIVTSTLVEWNNVKREVEESISDLPAVEFLREILGHRCEPGGPVHAAAERLGISCSEPFLNVPQGNALPNPLAAATSGQWIEGMSVLGFRGNSHGDLHADNILVPRPHQGSPSAEHFKRYVLIDLSTFNGRGLIAVDPAHLLLSIIASGLADVADARKGRLIRLILGAEQEESGGIPVQLASAIRGIRQAEVSFAASRGLYSEWRAESTLAIASCALLFVGRSLRDDDRRWFLELSGTAINAFKAMHPKRDQSAGQGDGLPRGDLSHSHQALAPEGSRPPVAPSPGAAPVHESLLEQADDAGTPEGTSSPGDDSAQGAVAALVPTDDAPIAPQEVSVYVESLAPPVIKNGTAACRALADELASEISALGDDMAAGTASDYLFTARGIVADLTAAIRTMLAWGRENPEERYITYQTALEAVRLRVRGVTEIMTGMSEKGTSPRIRDDAVAAVERLQHAITNIASLPDS